MPLKLLWDCVWLLRFGKTGSINQTLFFGLTLPIALSGRGCPYSKCHPSGITFVLETESQPSVRSAPVADTRDFDWKKWLKISANVFAPESTWEACWASINCNQTKKKKHTHTYRYTHTYCRNLIVIVRTRPTHNIIRPEGCGKNDTP